MRLKEFIDKTGISMSKFAKRADMTFSTVRNAVELKNITLESAYKIHLATEGKCKLEDMLPEGVAQSIKEPRVRKAHAEKDA